MRLYPALIVTFVIFIELISSLSYTKSLESRPDPVNLLRRKLLLSSSNILLSNHRKRLLFRGKDSRPGVKCNSSFYKQSRVAAVAEKACRDAFSSCGYLSRCSPLASYFKTTSKRFTGSPILFPEEDGEPLFMVRITKNFFSLDGFKAFLNLGKKDYIIFGGTCTSVGIVREISPNNFAKCEAVNGGSMVHTPAGLNIN
ncbi:hypothetical protein EV44_g0025 [Erysiphe necator]|uniref:Uncharacterized protein n=1 Tax=Uncinula necator TaxID=52586 RepID=A0A0B1PAB4_UNCNE|nr:hypothetical protein EV44_g0025 [Erysiphe necator]